MSTRGWYEYHVLNAATSRRRLAMQFYKWGDATPEGAIDEWRLLHEQIVKAGGVLPVVLLDDLLREQLGELYQKLPAHFSTAAFLFMLLRAKEERSPFKHLEYHDLPEEQRPDYRLGFEIGMARVLNGFRPRRHPEPLIEAVIGFIAAGHFLRPWKDYGLTWSVLEWLQYLTQITQEVDMGSIAGDLSKPFDVSFVHRFFIWVDPAQPFKIDRLAVELCDSDGRELLAKLQDESGKDEAQKLHDRRVAGTLIDLIDRQHVDQFTMDQANMAFQCDEDGFWSRSG